MVYHRFAPGFAPAGALGDRVPLSRIRCCADGARMKVDVEELEACKRRLSVEAPSEVVQQAWETAYGRVSKQARLPGFRKGHVPRNLVKLHFADEVRREVAQH